MRRRESLFSLVLLVSKQLSKEKTLSQASTKTRHTLAFVTNVKVMVSCLPRGKRKLGCLWETSWDKARNVGSFEYEEKESFEKHSAQRKTK